jgi:hypothetical protein
MATEIDLGGFHLYRYLYGENGKEERSCKLMNIFELSSFSVVCEKGGRLTINH